MPQWNLEDMIQYKDRSVIVLRKPAGLAVQSAKVYESDLESMLKNAFGEVHIVQRLDRGVEGLLVFAGTKKAAALLTAQLGDGRLKKEYTAKVSGTIPKDADTLTDYLVKDARNNMSRVAAPDEVTRLHAKKAVLDYRRIGESLLGITLHTGRHHQIRVQLSHAGMPILGDVKYGGEPWPSLCLCSTGVEFVHPLTGKTLSFHTEPASFDIHG